MPFSIFIAVVVKDAVMLIEGFVPYLLTVKDARLPVRFKSPITPPNDPPKIKLPEVDVNVAPPVAV
jgi:hypothetical protein